MTSPSFAGGDLTTPRLKEKIDKKRPKPRYRDLHRQTGKTIS
ncbi:hypothetical protein MGMO_36c00090 [Methyloglobulus morosus KoM1]|uniref:Uncharacterized protein n=1 Tax=Methyloglobulus morosus KoM1 TaxID=1116472 RepID=V5BII4_9GAMM|nr:hypothetical protein MGMO_36c00090 [Methyloglobulus morosus KoM1]